MLQLIGHEQMADRGHICAAQIERLDNGGFKLRIAELAAHADHRHHGPRACLASLLADHLLPEPVIALRPSALRSPLRQRLRSAQRAGLPFQHIEIVFQIEDLAGTIITALMAGDPDAVVAELDTLE